MEYRIKYIFCIILSAAINILGGWDIWLKSLLTTIILDIVSGIMKAFLLHSNKSASGGLSSQSILRGGIKKLFILLMVALGTVLDTIITPDDKFIRIMVVSYYIAGESVSILENIGACGVPLPKAIYKVLDTLKSKGDN